MMVIGEGQKFPAALIVPSFAFIKDWAERKGMDLRNASNQQIIENKEVIARIDREVKEYNKRFGNWEQIKKFELLPTEFTIEGGELTPTLKFKRKKILEKYQTEFNRIYND